MIIEIERERALELIDSISRAIAERKMASAAILWIESLRPLHSIGSQLMYFLAPFAEVIFNARSYQEFASLLEDDEYVRLLLKRIDDLDYEIHYEERKQKRLLRQRSRNKRKAFFKNLFKK
ncbi:MAG: hypothetical protein J7K89_05540 [Candidatus Cloacimonetes bacterium]|nr:hypothetical protein [Candidatus Cloacimonadota bacterium]